MKTNSKKISQCWRISLAVLLLSSFMLLPGIARAETCAPWVKGIYTKESPCVSYQGKNFKAQWWVDVAPPTVIPEHVWDNAWAYISTSEPAPPPPGVPGNPQIISPVSGSESIVGNKISFTWTMSGIPGTSWEVFSGATSLYKGTDFVTSTQTAQSGKTDLSLAAGQYSLTVKLCNTTGCGTSSAVAVTVKSAETAGLCTPWVNNKGYPQDSYVSYQGQNYKTQWWANQGDAPHVGVPNAWDSPWVKATNCGSQEPPPPAPGKPVVSPISDSTVKQVSLKWTLNAADVKGTSWSVLDNFNGTSSSIYGPSTTFDAGTTQAGTAALTLDNGTHQLTVRLCNANAVCTDSAVATAKVTLPPEPLPGTPVLASIPNSTNGKFTVNWTMTGKPATYWEVWNGATRMQRFTNFATQSANSQTGTATLTVNNGTYTVKVKLCNSEDKCADSNVQTVTVSGAADKKAFFMAYYPTWYEPAYNAFCTGQFKDPADKTWKPCAVNTVLSNDYIKANSLLAGGIPDYVTHVMLSFGKFNLMHNWWTATAQGTKNAIGDTANLNRTTVGLDFVSSSRSVKEEIRALKETHPGLKVILALGGASFNDSWSGVTDDDIHGAAQLIVDLDIDGLDVDYEIQGAAPTDIQNYKKAIVDMRKAVDEAQAKSGKEKLLTLAGWSTGADCTALTQNTSIYPQCAGKVSWWGGSGGRELQVFQEIDRPSGKTVASMIDMIGVMAYDAGYELYDPIVAYKEYRAIARPDARIAIGVEPPPQAWGGAVTTVDDKSKTCVGNLIPKDQYQNPVNEAATVKRLADALQPGDGLMMWSLFLEDKERAVPNRDALPCGNTGVTNIARAISEVLGLGSDRTTQIDWYTAINFAR